MKICEDQKEVKSEKNIPTQKKQVLLFSCVCVFLKKFVHVINNYFIDFIWRGKRLREKHPACEQVVLEK